MNYKKKNQIGCLLLLLVIIVIKFFLDGPHLDRIFTQIRISLMLLLILSIVLMVIPLSIRLINKERIEYKKGKIICILNSTILYIISFIPNLIVILTQKRDELLSLDPVSLSLNIIFYSLIIVVIYYFINMCFFVKNKN